MHLHLSLHPYFITVDLFSFFFLLPSETRRGGGVLHFLVVGGTGSKALKGAPSRTDLIFGVRFPTWAKGCRLGSDEVGTLSGFKARHYCDSIGPPYRQDFTIVFETTAQLGV